MATSPTSTAPDARMLRLPTRIRVEASSYCQLRCPSCPTATREIDAHVGRGFLDPADLARLLDANPRIREVELANYGEAFLNPRFVEILRVLHERGVWSRLGTGANLNNARPEMLEAVVRLGMRSITCSIDGATQATYELYRRRGNLVRVLDNVRTINAWKARLGSETPQLDWQMVLFEHNRHEVEAARALATGLGMRFRLKLSWDEDLSPLDADGSLARELALPAVRRGDVQAQDGAPFLATLCNHLWRSPVVNWDGKVLGCCRNFWGDFGGNAFAEGLDGALRHEKLSYGKAMLEGRAPPRPDIPCSTCEIYLERQKTAYWMTPPASETANRRPRPDRAAAEAPPGRQAAGGVR